MKIFDISHYQDGIQIQKAVQYGYEGVILRTGYGSKKKDKCVDRFSLEAQRCGLWTGFYHYSTAIGYHTGFREGQLAVDIIRRNFKGTTSLFCDLENNKNKCTNMEALRGFRDAVEESDYDLIVGVYSSEYMFQHYFDLEWIRENKLPVWVAKYNTVMPQIGIPYNIWQYTSDKIPGDFYSNKLDRSIVINPNVEIPKKTENLTATAKDILNVIQGNYGDGDKRKELLRNAGLDPDAVQAEVNRYYYLGVDILEGKYGNGEKRKEAVQKAGYDYVLARAVVNTLYYNR